jgi:hypothetical protein
VKIKINPFHDLYVTENIWPTNFVHLFSPELIAHSETLFIPGNVVLKGIQGSGKSMLLNLLKPEIQCAYAKEKVEFPVKNKQRNFIGAGINLSYSQAFSFGQRVINASKSNNKVDQLPLFFADYLNYWIVGDLLKSLNTLFQAEKDGLKLQVKLELSPDKLDKFAIELAKEECWFNYFKGVSSYNDLTARIAKRMIAYRSFFNFNIDELPEEILTTKTVVGEPLSTMSKKLRSCSIISKQTDIFISIDQYEELYYLEGVNQDLKTSFRQIINKALSSRDPHISYKVGTRGYAWDIDLGIYGSTGKLERERNYKFIDLSALLQRQENRTTWIFPKFAENVLERRLKVARYEVDEHKDLTHSIFGSGLSAEEKAIKYAGTSPSKMITKEKELSKTVVTFLKKLAEKSPLSAKLGEAWCLQKGVSRLEAHSKDLPWETKEGKWWKKERIEQSLLQIAGKSQQNLIWSGKEDILELSGGNILVFVSICQYIWAYWLQSLSKDSDQGTTIPQIPSELQAVAIFEASRHWHSKIPESYNGNDRQRFINYLGTEFNKKLYQDYFMSYPGHNGFSVLLEELNSEPEVRKFLSEAVEFSDLLTFPHTTKTNDRKKRQKWYLKPILCPYFKIPHIRTKEPLYITMEILKSWMRKSNLPFAEDFLVTTDRKTKIDKSTSAQLNLFE